MEAVTYVPVRSIGVFLGANPGKEPKYECLARDVAGVFHANKWKLGQSPSVIELSVTLDCIDFPQYTAGRQGVLWE
jgi:hypothetical protein